MTQLIDLFYAGIGSRDTPPEVMAKMKKIATILERLGFILRSGGAVGADAAFESGVLNKNNMNIYLPFTSFNERRHNGINYIYVEDFSKDYDEAHKSLIHHPIGFKLKGSARKMMIRNYFQVCGLLGQSNSKFIICWTKGGANGISVKTTWDDGGTAQAIRIASSINIPVYNLKDSRYSCLSEMELIKIILSNLKNGILPDKEVSAYKVTNIFE